MRRALVPGMTIAAMLVLTGCNDVQPEPFPSGGESASATATPTPTPTPTLEPLTLVDCETLFPMALASTELISGDPISHPLVNLGELPVTDFFGWTDLPEVTAALTGSPQAKLCGWELANTHIGAGMRLHVAEVTPGTRAAIEAALPGAGFSSASNGTVTSYERSTEHDVATVDITLLFTGDLWIMCNSIGGPCGDVAAFALDAQRTANPTLGL